MKLFSFSKKKERDFLVLDFGASSIKGLIFRPLGDKILIKKCGVCDLDQFGVFSAKDFQNDLIKKALTELLTSLIGNLKPAGFKTIISFPSSILKSAVVDVSLKRKNPSRKIDKAEEEKIRKEIVHSAGKKLFQIIQKKIGKDPSVFQIVKTRVIDKKISGYKVNSVFGFRGERLDFKVLLVFGLAENLNFIQNLIKEFQFSDFYVAHEVEGLLAARRFFKENNTFIDIGGNTTKVFIFNDVLEATCEIEVGGSQFSKKISDQLGITFHQAEQLKSSFMENSMSEQGQQKIKAVITPLFSQWQESLQEEFLDKKRILRGDNSFLVFGGESKLFTVLRNSFCRENGIGQAQWHLDLLDIKKLPLLTVGKVNVGPRFIPSILLAFSSFNF